MSSDPLEATPTKLIMSLPAFTLNRGTRMVRVARASQTSYPPSATVFRCLDLFHCSPPMHLPRCEAYIKIIWCEPPDADRKTTRLRWRYKILCMKADLSFPCGFIRDPRQ